MIRNENEMKYLIEYNSRIKDLRGKTNTGTRFTEITAVSDFKAFETLQLSTPDAELVWIGEAE